MARMHSALIAVVAHLLSRLGAQALNQAEVRRLSLVGYNLFSGYT